MVSAVAKLLVGTDAARGEHTLHNRDWVRTYARTYDAARMIRIRDMGLDPVGLTSSHAIFFYLDNVLQTSRTG